MDPWHYDPAVDLEQPLVERLRHFPRQPDMLVYGLRSLAALVCRGWLGMYHRFRIVGRNHLPAAGSFVLVANHASHLDTLCLLAALPLGRLHQTFPAAARDYFFVSAPRTFAAAVFANALPFERETSPRQSLAVCRALLENPGNILILFPEGSRSTTGQMAEFRPGIGMMLAGCDMPAIPCYIRGAHAALPKGAWIPRPWSVTLTIGRPQVYAHLPATKEAARHICRDLHEAVKTLGENDNPDSPHSILEVP